MRKQHGGIRFWTLLWGLGLAGQLCWNIENQWFNTFIYAKIMRDSDIVTVMVLTSALVSTFSTFFFGALSDRFGSRRRFIGIGYIVWGLFTILFGLNEYIAGGTVGTGTKLSLLAAALVILTDNIMSFFGSMGNDAGFNAWSNDYTTDRNRGQIGAALAVLPVLGTILGTVLGGLLIGADDNYQRLFWVMGGFVILMGILSLLFLKDAQGLERRGQGGFWRQFSAVFDFKSFLARRELALACVTAAVFFVSFNIYFVHMGNWMIYRMGFTPDSMGLVQGGGLALAMLLSIPAAMLINRHKTPFVAGMAILLNLTGLWVLYAAVRPGTVDTANPFSAVNLPLLGGVFLCGAGLILMMQGMTMWVKQLYPEENRGQFEGVRVLFFTLLPMLIGTNLGNIAVKTGAGTVTNEFGVTENIPAESLFFWAVWALLPAVVPLIFAGRLYGKRVRGEAHD